MDKCGLSPVQITSEVVHELFLQFDEAKNKGNLRVAEIDKTIADLWPPQNKKTLMRAYKSADFIVDGSITEGVFGRLLKYLAYYNELWILFDRSDDDHDHGISFEEFQEHFMKLLPELKASDDDIHNDFVSLDVNRSGTILLSDFCAFYAKNKTDFMVQNPDSDGLNRAMAHQIFSLPTFTNEEVHDLFERFDANNHNGLLSLAEIDKAIMELWPELFKHKPAIMRAYHTADLSNDGFITENEFGELLTYLAYYDKLYNTFSILDTDSDHRLDFEEYRKGHLILGITVSDDQLKQEFESIDLNHGGFILFDEFCHYMSQKLGRPGHSKNSDLISSGFKVKSSPKIPLAPALTATSKNSIHEPHIVESAVKSGITLSVDKKWSKEQIHDLFEIFDANNHNGLLSLAEIDKAIMELWPELFKHKPAIMRAYHTADLSNDGFITENEFGELLTYLAYYDNIFEEFSKMDYNHDKRIDFEEFRKGHEILGLNSDDSHLKQEFERIDLNHGGFILFDEFCHYMAARFGRPGNSTNSDLISEETFMKSEHKARKSFVKVARPTSDVFQDHQLTAQENVINTGIQEDQELFPKKSLKPIVFKKKFSVNRVETSEVEAHHASSTSDQPGTRKQAEIKRLERTIEALRHQLQQFSGSDEYSRQYLSGWDSMTEKNYRLTIKLEKEQRKNDDMRQSMIEMSEKIRQMEIEARREFMEETKRAKQVQNLQLTREVRDLKAEKAKFERLHEELARKLALTEEKNAALTEELFILRQQFGVSKGSQQSSKCFRKAFSQVN